jgi:hypothetical protein
MGVLIGIKLIDKTFTVGQLVYNKDRDQFILASSLIFNSLLGRAERIIESDYFSPEDVVYIETHCKPDFVVLWEDALRVRPFIGLGHEYRRFRDSQLLPQFTLTLPS